MSNSGSEVSLLPVRVKPRARRAGILARHGSGIKVAVRAAPERGRANEELVEILARALGVTRHDVEIVAGATSQDKTVRVCLSADVLQRRLRHALQEQD